MQLRVQQQICQQNLRAQSLLCPILMTTPVTPVTAWGQVRGVVQFRIDSLTHNTGFSIKFIGPNPENTVENLTRSGGKKNPIVFELNTEGDYIYDVIYSPSGTTMGEYTLRCRPMHLV